ncbi:MAG TPA: Uma2 family endonuclease [Gammaproteobacteria bacterium]|nr:Uma2 family endonuclease [Gammaproteobacteria bacterium]
MGAIQRPRHRYRFEEYLALCEDSTVRLEFWDGHIYAMAGGSVEHSRLSLRIGSLLDQRRPSGCVALESNTRIRPLASDRATYADAVLVCGGYEYHPADPENKTISNPAVVVEVLSDSTAEDDQTDKFDHYKLAPSLTDYLLIWQDDRRVELRTKRPEGWLVRTYGSGETVELHGGIRFSMDELYAR